MRSRLFKLLKVVSPIRHRISTNRILELCNTVAPGDKGTRISLTFLFSSLFLTVCLGGSLFENWIRQFGTRYRKKKLSDGTKRDLCDKKNFLAVFRKDTAPFHGFLISTMAQLSAQGRHQLFYHTENAAFHGLSRAGIHNLAALGMMMKLGTYDVMTKEAMEQDAQTIRYVQRSQILQCFTLCAYVGR